MASAFSAAALRRLGIPILVVHDPAGRVAPFADAECIATVPLFPRVREEGLEAAVIEIEIRLGRGKGHG